MQLTKLTKLIARHSTALPLGHDVYNFNNCNNFSVRRVVIISDRLNLTERHVGLRHFRSSALFFATPNATPHF